MGDPKAGGNGILNPGSSLNDEGDLLEKLRVKARDRELDRSVEVMECELTGEHNRLMFFYDLKNPDSTNYDVMRAHCMKCDTIVERPLTAAERAEAEKHPYKPR